jgi:signal transduction histidine kinase
MRARQIAPWAAAFLTLGTAACAATLDALASGHAEGAWTQAAWLAALLASTGVGVLLATRRRDNVIGLLLLANGLVLAANGLAATYAQYAVFEHRGAPGGEWAVLFNDRGWPTLFAAVTAIAFVFPDGRLPSPRWRPVAIAAAVSFAGLFVVSLFSTDPFAAPYEHVASPLPQLPHAVVAIPYVISGLGVVASLIAAALAVRTRLRRSRGVERLQIKWLAYAAMLIPTAVVASTIEGAITGENGSFTVFVTVVALIAVPVAIGVAVMRYRLYDIDRLINRTLVYAGLTAGLAGTYAGVALLLGVGIGGGSTIPTAVATLTVALAFSPLRSRIQVLVDRRFDRARYDGLRIVERYLEDLRAGRAAPEATGAVLAEALADPTLELLFWLPEVGCHVDAAGKEIAEDHFGSRAHTAVNRGSLHLATVLHDRALDNHPDLLASVIEAAGLAIEIARLRVEVIRQLAEVEDSRTRIVTAGYAERRRLERDLHDGAQQRLVSIGLALRHVQARLPSASPEAGELDTAVDELGRAIEELRELARGVRPAGLDDGLAPALEGLARRSPLRTTVRATAERFEDGVETTVYFVASEALANAAKHARASYVNLDVARTNGSLILTVADDGVGGALATAGSGLAGINDRVAALGGSVHVDSPAGHGTTVTAELPCA